MTTIKKSIRIDEHFLGNDYKIKVVQYTLYLILFSLRTYFEHATRISQEGSPSARTIHIVFKHPTHNNVLLRKQIGS